ncbi:hypothetical protein O181_086036 [Austropuccinia psidii MF-1]|uniref:Uncharacterized protein n=1 Tax=Austropuccinia psidii MF-1 TaxID=1389203 RepID=A0A9Q3FZF1_9BASI|nr:hypothetical protein [Austropuccinia psidii MF-1]
MIPPHSKDFGFPRDYSLQRETTISWNRGLEKREVEVVKSHNTWKNEPSYTSQDGFQQKAYRNGLHTIAYSNPENLQRTSPMKNGRQGIEPRAPLRRACRKYSEDFPQRYILERLYHKKEIEPEITYYDPFRFMRTGNPIRLPSGFTPLRHQEISDQDSPYFPITDRIQERKRITAQEQDFFQPEAERVRSDDPEIVGPVAINTKKQQTVVNTSNAASSPKIRNYISTQMKHNVVIPGSTISINTPWLKFSQFVEQTQKEFERLHEKINPQTQGHVSGKAPYHKEDIKPDSLLEKKPRSQSQYQDGDKITYSEKEALKLLPVASSWPKFSGIGECDHMELIDYIDGLFTDVPSRPDYWITSRLNTAFKGNASIWYTEIQEINGRRNWP